MNVATIKMPGYEARKKRAEYLRAMRGEHTKQDEALKNAFRELAHGRQILDLHHVLRTAGTDDQRRPRLAIARASDETVWFNGSRWHEYSRMWYFGPYRSVSEHETRINVFLPRDVYPDRAIDAPALRAVVPMIPPDIRPPKDKLDDYHILWEAEWEEMPKDPMLLKHVGANLYTVVATWNLTKLEQAVLRDRDYE